MTGAEGERVMGMGGRQGKAQGTAGSAYTYPWLLTDVYDVSQTQRLRMIGTSFIPHALVSHLSLYGFSLCTYMPGQKALSRF